jgi:NTP pyrophosphatase (non-canonical NTP hydrolase)
MRINTNQGVVTQFLHDVSAELQKALTKHPSGMHGPHEAYGVILEEVDEFWDEVRAQQHDKAKMRKELVQVAAMCARAVLDLDLDT